MHRSFRTGRSAGVRFFSLATMLLLGCGDGLVTPSEPPDASVTDRDAALDARVADPDARVVRATRDAGVDDDDDDGAADGATPSAGGDRCGDVTAADHAPFRAIQKLATTDEEVRVLVYGQSISEQGWWEKTKQWLEQTYPNGKLVMEEHARGGCAAQCLIGNARWSDGQQHNRLPEDVFAWKPDLVIFHVYGDHNDYQYVMEGLKSGCAAFDDYKTFDGQSVPQVRCTDAQRAMSQGYRAPEVLVQNDFVNKTPAASCPDTPNASQWDCYMNDKIIPEVVAKHGYVLQDNFHAWDDAARAEGVDPKATIDADETHLSEPAGTDVMFDLTVPHLCFAP
ncbi:MAG: hypothetical protein ABW252_24845 [Polyangiales bacterium]